MLKKLLMMSVVLLFGTMPSWAGQVTFAPAENGSVTADPSSPEPGATVTLTVNPATGYILDAISAEVTIDPGSAQLPRRAEGPHVGMPVELTTVTEGTTYTFVMPEAPYNVKVTATFKEAEYTVTVAQGIEHGTVTADPTTAHYGDEVNVVAVPAEGYEVETLTYTAEGGEPVPIDNGVFNMPAANVTINATFKKVNYTITLNCGPNGYVEAPQGANMGDVVNVSVYPATGYEIDELTYSYDIIDVAGSQLPYPFHYEFYIENGQFTMPAANVTINATFKKVNYTITVAETENGTVTAPATAQFGDEVTVNVTPAPGCVLETLTYTVEGENPVAIENGMFIMPADNVTINATFKKIDYTITLNCGPNGTVLAAQTANYGDEVIVIATPNEGYEIESLTYSYDITEVEGSQLPNPLHYEFAIENGHFTMPAANVTINATFKAISYTITVAETVNGTVEAPATAHFGDNVTVTVTPAEGYELQSLTYTVEGANPVTIENNAFTMPAANVTINATFTAIDYTITVGTIENGTVEADKQTATLGELVTLTVTPASEIYELATITVTYDDGIDVIGDAPRRAMQNVAVTKVDESTYTFNMPAGDVNVNATFTEKVITAINDINATQNGKEVRYFDLQGRYIGTSLESASNGIYVTSDGRKVVK